MTERKYVETLMRAAAHYIEVLEGTADLNEREHIERWRALRDDMSAHTFVRLAGAWLKEEANR